MDRTTAPALQPDTFKSPRMLQSWAGNEGEGCCGLKLGGSRTGIVAGPKAWQWWRNSTVNMLLRFQAAIWARCCCHHGHRREARQGWQLALGPWTWQGPVLVAGVRCGHSHCGQAAICPQEQDWDQHLQKTKSPAAGRRPALLVLRSRRITSEKMAECLGPGGTTKGRCRWLRLCQTHLPHQQCPARAAAAPPHPSLGTTQLHSTGTPWQHS